MADADLKVKGIKTTDAAGNVINPAKEDGNLATIAGKDFATETTLTAIKTGTDKIITSPATEAKQDDIITAINNGLQSPTDMEGGGKNLVGTIPVEVTFAGITEAIIISADSANTGEIYVGKSNVTSAGANAINFLLPGESIELSYNDTTNPIYVVANAAGQNFYKGALL